MNIVCDKCSFVFNRDTVFNGHIIEEYINTYGTKCPNCGHIIKSVFKPDFVKQNEQKLEDYRRQVREILSRKLKLKGNQNGDT